MTKHPTEIRAALGAEAWHAWDREVRARAPADLDTVILLTGDEGSGKSTLAWHLSHWWDHTFEPDRMAFNRQEFIRSHLKARPGQAVVFDEGADALFSRNAMTGNNKKMSTYLMFARQRRVISTVCLPRIIDADRYIQLRAAYWIHVPRRGYAEVQLPNKSQQRQEVWWKPALALTFDKAEGPDWRRYRRRKNDRIRRIGKQLAEA